MATSLQTRAQKLGDLIRNARMDMDKSEQECAQAMGVDTEIFVAYEKGEKAPSLPEIEVLAFFLNIPIDHFFGRESNSFESQENTPISQLENLLPLRHRIIGILLRKSRLEAGITLEELARHTEIEQANLEIYELGNAPVPMPELEMMTIALNLSIREFLDKSGPVGKWAIQMKATEDFQNLPLELQEFVSKPVNLPYLELAVRLSEMSVDRLRAVAEGLLEITY